MNQRTQALVLQKHWHPNAEKKHARIEKIVISFLERPWFPEVFFDDAFELPTRNWKCFDHSGNFNRAGTQAARRKYKNCEKLEVPECKETPGKITLEWSRMPKAAETLVNEEIARSTA